jgi:hypothetical protein
MSENVEDFSEPVPKVFGRLARHVFGAIELELPNISQISLGERSAYFAQRLTSGNQIVQLQQVRKAKPRNRTFVAKCFLNKNKIKNTKKNN